MSDRNFVAGTDTLDDALVPDLSKLILGAGTDCGLDPVIADRTDGRFQAQAGVAIVLELARRHVPAFCCFSLTPALSSRAFLGASFRSFCATILTMTGRRLSAFERDFEQDMSDPEYRRAYERSRARIDAIDRVINSLDEMRERQGLSKAELARRIGVSDAVIRRLFSAQDRNPTIKTIVEVADALGLELRVARPPTARKAS
ncbi:MAG: helix-turn-helix transcriptional regulator [Actinomycetota bacterium]|nr:helix-turn-helix transcriptional regulator [Actinomycetota bacterium]